MKLWGWRLRDGVNAKRKRQEISLFLSFSACIYQRKAMWGHEQEQGPHQDLGCPGTLISRFQPASRTLRKPCLLFKPPVSGICHSSLNLPRPQVSVTLFWNLFLCIDVSEQCHSESLVCVLAVFFLRDNLKAGFCGLFFIFFFMMLEKWWFRF